MYRPVQPRHIIDRRHLNAELDALAERLSGDKLRAALLARLRQAVEEGRQEIRHRFEAGLPETDPPRGAFEPINGSAAAHSLSYLIDQVLRVLYDFTLTHIYPTPNPTAGERLALLAVGGYGRGELAPQSDIDLMFLIPQRATTLTEQVVEFILYMLWDLGFKVGHATRSVEENIRRAKSDMTIRTALLEMRYIWGDQDLPTRLREAFETEVVSGSEAEFIEAKLAERDERHQRVGGSRYVLEPNIKEGKGGLRDLQLLFWLAKYVYRVDTVEALVGRGVLLQEEARLCERAHQFLWTLRFHLHYLIGRPEERLTFDLQTTIGTRMGYSDRVGIQGVERFMKYYFLIAKDVGDLTRIFCAALEAQQKRRTSFGLTRLALKLGSKLAQRGIEGFSLDRGRLTVSGAEHFDTRPIDLIRLFWVAQQNSVDIHPDALHLITRNLRLIDNELRADPEANRLFLEILTSRKDPEIGLRRMSEAGVLGRFIPDFGRVIAQMQYNMYHVYTVDEHTLLAIGLLNQIERGVRKEDLPIASEVIHKILCRRELFMAVFMHDIAKGRPGDHSEVGAELCLKLCPRLGFNEEETETIAWLVRYHLLMSDTAFKRDIEDPKTVRDFADMVQSVERLRLLLLLTVVDIGAVGPQVWNNWKATLLRRLYNITEDLLSGGLLAAGRQTQVAVAKQEARQAMERELPHWSDDECEAFLSRGHPSYWLSFEARAHVRHARMVAEAERSHAPLIIETEIDGHQGVTEVTVLANDHPGLLPQLAGGLAICGATIVNARVYTFDNGLAIDSFTIQDALGPDGHGPFDRSDKLAKLSATLQQSLEGRLHVPDELAKRRQQEPKRIRVFTVTPRVLVDNRASNTHTLIEVTGRDRPGFLFLVTRTLSRLGLQISTAKISTFGERAVDAFYVKDVFGLKIQHDSKLKQIRKELLEILHQADAEEAAGDPSLGGKSAA